MVIFGILFFSLFCIWYGRLCFLKYKKQNDPVYYFRNFINTSLERPISFYIENKKLKKYWGEACNIKQFNELKDLGFSHKEIIFISPRLFQFIESPSKQEEELACSLAFFNFFEIKNKNVLHFTYTLKFKNAFTTDFSNWTQSPYYLNKLLELEPNLLKRIINLYPYLCNKFENPPLYLILEAVKSHEIFYKTVNCVPNSDLKSTIKFLEEKIKILGLIENGE